MNPLASPLLTDLYQLSMLQAYFAADMRDTAVFELFVRKLPANRSFLMAAGLEQVLDFVESARFSADDLDWLDQSGLFRPDFVRWLGDFRFSGDVHALPEGRVFFANEPVLRVTAPLPEAQLLETRVLNLIHFETLIATKAARTVIAAGGRGLVDFGLRRAHAGEAGLLAARASYLAGFAGSATTLAGKLYGIPVFGTMAHSFVQAHDDETAAFRNFAEVFPGNALLLIDTYDTLEAARKVVALAPELAARGIPIRGVRLDSGDLAALARSVRKILDEGGLGETIIFASGNLDEHRVRDLVAEGAPIASFGVGTSLTTSSDAPYLDAVYKLQEYAGRPRRKRSAGKATWPGRKQVYRHYAADGTLDHDVVSLEGDPQNGEPCIELVMRAGKRLGSPTTLAAARSRAAAELERLPPALRALDGSGASYRVDIAPALVRLAEEVDRATGQVVAA